MFLFANFFVVFGLFTAFAPISGAVDLKLTFEAALSSAFVGFLALFFDDFVSFVNFIALLAAAFLAALGG